MRKKKYNIGAACLGNGTTVYDRNEMKYGDYKKIAHISEDGHTIEYYEDLPSDVMDQINKYKKQ
jgi:hypothetical protein